MTSSTRRWNGSTGTTTAGCTASSATSHPPSSKPPTTLNQRHSNRSRHQHEAGNEPETVHRAVRRQAWAMLVSPARWWRLTAKLRRVAITAGPLPVRILGKGVPEEEREVYG